MSEPSPDEKIWELELAGFKEARNPILASEVDEPLRLIPVDPDEFDL